MNKHALTGLLTLVFMIFIVVEPSMTGPGGKIASAAFGTFWGRVILGILTFIFLPLITYVSIAVVASLHIQFNGRLNNPVRIR